MFQGVAATIFHRQRSCRVVMIGPAERASLRKVESLGSKCLIPSVLLVESKILVAGMISEQCFRHEIRFTCIRPQSCKGKIGHQCYIQKINLLCYGSIFIFCLDRKKYTGADTADRNLTEKKKRERRGECMYICIIIFFNFILNFPRFPCYSFM